MKEFTDYLDSLKNYEKSGVPKGAGTDSDDGFDFGTMRRLMHSLGNPQSKFKVCVFTTFCNAVVIVMSFFVAQAIEHTHMLNGFLSTLSLANAY